MKRIPVLVVALVGCNPPIAKDSQVLTVPLSGDAAPFGAAVGVGITVSEEARDTEVELYTSASGLFSQGASIGLELLLGLDVVGSDGGGFEDDAAVTVFPDVATCPDALGYALGEDGSCTVAFVAVLSGDQAYSLINGYFVKARAPDKDWAGDEDAVTVTLTAEVAEPEP